MNIENKIEAIRGGITAVSGFKATGFSAGIKKNKALDMALIAADVPCVSAGVFTKNLFPAPPILLNKHHLKNGKGQAIIANSGNANAFTGSKGAADAKKMAQETATALNIPVESVFVASTGVISVHLPMEKILPAIPTLVDSLSKKGSRAAATAIMTTDTCPKEAAFKGQVGNEHISIGGIAKGAGMIHPNMATMLAFLSSDVSITQPLLQEALKDAVDDSFHRITIDRDTSTNDMVLILANGKKGNTITKKGKTYDQFCVLLKKTCFALAKKLVEDAEGATKLIEIKVTGTKTNEAAKKIAFAIANSLLVKTAFYGEDANWGRIIAAIGNSGIKVKPNEIDLFFGPHALVQNGEYLGKKAEGRIDSYLKKKTLQLHLALQSGNGTFDVWTCDLSLDYIKINALYRS